MKAFELLFNKLHHSYNHQLPFVAYKYPNDTRIKALFQQNSELHYVTDKKDSGFVFAPFDSNERTILIPSEKAAYLEADFKKKSLPIKEETFFQTNVKDKTKHLDLVNEAIRFIENGQAEKVVVSRKETLVPTSFSIEETFKSLLNNYTNAFVYVWYHPSIGLWLGATPEKLLTIQKNNFKTVSLAGTQVFNNSLNVTWGAKEIEEQQLVTAYLESALKPLAETLDISEVETVRAGNLLHLRSEIKGTLKSEITLHLLLKLVHPTPAVCGLPKETAKTFIRIHEGYNREYYTGYLGELHVENKTNLYVNLRCMKYEDPKVFLFLGGGITKDSRALDEWNETVEKSKVLKKVL